MNHDNFVQWLMVEKTMSKRSAKDVLSRCGRICRMLKIDEINKNSLDNLKHCDQFINSSMFIKSQLKRATVLYLEYIDEGGQYR